jgi:hypothetical protein
MDDADGQYNCEDWDRPDSKKGIYLVSTEYSLDDVLVKTQTSEGQGMREVAAAGTYLQHQGGVCAANQQPGICDGDETLARTSQ